MPLRSRISTKERKKQEYKKDLHPYSFALEKLKEADSDFQSKNWAAARKNYSLAAQTLNRLPINDETAFRHCLLRLATTQLKTFNLIAAVITVVQVNRIERFSAQSEKSEAADIMARIKSSRPANKNSDYDNYTPTFYVGHM
jgi:hypothetical protein